MKLGSQGLEVSKLGFGCMGLTGIYNSPLSKDEVISIVTCAFAKGITLFDTADIYGAHTMKFWLARWVELKQLVEEGKIKYIGLSESSPDMISRMRLSLFADIDRCLMDLRLPFSDLGIIVVPYSPLGRGFFSGKALWRVYMRELSWYS
ncbi:hypothetical protein V6N13_137478 [Hibiscus sabdariffa]